MYKILKSSKTNEDKLYNKILLLSRNKFFYTKLLLSDTFQNRINLIFLHISFIFMKINEAKNVNQFKKYYQKLFDLTFHRIELNMRELGHSDTSVNKNMKSLVKDFYNILINCEKYKLKTSDEKRIFIRKYLNLNIIDNTNVNNDLIEYFNDYQSFCLDLSLDNVLKNDFNLESNFLEIFSV